MKILIVEDEKEITDGIKAILEKEGFSTDVAYDGKKGLECIEDNMYDLVLLDIMLPYMSGIEILKEIREEGIQTPVILLTAKSMIDDKIVGLDAGADDYMTKPFSPSELVARVKAHLARYNRLVSSSSHKPVGNDTIEVNGLKIDKLARRVFLDGEEKPFTGKEYDLLLYLAENPNRVFGKEDLFREIWKAEPAGTDIATVTVHIKKIREKIEKDSSHPLYIETLWGVGYRFKM